MTALSLSSHREGNYKKKIAFPSNHVRRKKLSRNVTEILDIIMILNIFSTLSYLVRDDFLFSLFIYMAVVSLLQ